MSNTNMINLAKQQSSICPTNGRQTVGDGAFSTDMTPSVLAVCHMQGTDEMYYYSTTFSGGPGFFPGGFDTPMAKCPPDRGSSDWVTDSPAPFFSSSPSSASTLSLLSLGTDSLANSIEYPPTPPPDNAFSPSAPRSIIHKNASLPDPATPPLTPDDGDGIAGISSLHAGAALDFLSAIFPRNALGALSFAKSVSISAANLGAVFEGVVLELPGTPKTLYVDGKSAAHVNLRESIVALLDLADERLQCSALVIALERSSPALGDLLHSLMYVGGTVVTKPPFQVDSAYVLVGMEM
ncbi:ornithine decarboxylase antizyme-domain-containing protein [Amylocystis lapponica]|nr:ornithine decarboxylase antizyme-domain-containing protein [Amylocystis lapponica]